MAYMLSFEQVWSVVDERSWLLTSTVEFSDGDKRTLKMRTGRTKAMLDDAFGEHQILVAGIHHRMFMDCLKAKNERPVSVKSQWLDQRQKGDDFHLTSVVNYSNWLRQRQQFSFDHAPTDADRAEINRVVAQAIEETLGDHNDWVGDPSLSSEGLVAHFELLKPEASASPEEHAEWRSRAGFYRATYPTASDFKSMIAAAEKLKAEGKLPHRVIHVETDSAGFETGE